MHLLVPSLPHFHGAVDGAVAVGEFASGDAGSAKLVAGWKAAAY